MEPPSSGRRHNRGESSRSGAISVAELIRKQPPPRRILSRDEAGTDGLVTDLLGTAPLVDQPEPRRSPAVKLAALVLGTASLCATVAAASMITGNRQPAATAPARHNAVPSVITGAAALRPDLLSSEVNGSTPATGTVPASTSTQPTAVAKAGRSEVTGSRLTSAAVSTAVAQSPVDAVRQFYNTVRTDPQDALNDWVDSTLMGVTQNDFARSWSGVRSLRTDRVEAISADSVLGVIAFQQLDGSWLRVEQLLRLNGQSPPKIVGAEVLSAQRG
ncbi:hypothetical protein [Kutzneria albida]|uniref:Uncharacterized protein n=1 Tax=Kutzneria albida DSM 43870 TaxID=1449976 RepID=W5WTK0_9PSEU|nr:hypothetical protein [Kutzneria albida]AHI01490.1 hypothetical protein KALB_8132 [Kutzneria albida DSM 43870]